MFGGGFDQRGRPDLILCTDSLPLAARPDVLVFQSEPLPDPLDVLGSPICHLWASSSALDTDFTLKLVDVYPPHPDYPAGFALNLCDTIVRARYRNGRRTAELIEPGKVYLFELELPPVCNRFERGHRIRLDVSSSSAPQFDVNPNTGEPLGTARGAVRARNTIWHSATYPSQLVLPVAAGSDHELAASATSD